MEDISKLTKEKLYELYVVKNLSRSQIAEMYGVSKSKIAYLLSKYDINLYEKRGKEFLLKLKEQMGEDSFQKAIIEVINLDQLMTVEELSRALAHYCFRNGPVEDMHSEGKLSQDDMKILNKFCYNKIYTFFKLLISNEKEKLYSKLKFHSLCGNDWDPPVLDI